MEFNEKLQALRKSKDLTQEELAASLFISRTAISKWESGRGYPSIESLKAIAKFFSLSLDELLSSDELINITESGIKERDGQRCALIFGLLDVCALMLLFLPFFGQEVGGAVKAVSLISLSGISVYLKIAYFATVIGLALVGLTTLTFQIFRISLWKRHKIGASLIMSAIGVVLFIATLEAYAAAFLFIFLAVKAILIKKQP